MHRHWSEIGAMRLLLLAFTVLLLPVVWWSDLPPHGIGVLTSYVAPTLVTLLFFVLALDALMNRVFLAGDETAAAAVLRLRMRLALGAIALLLVFWGPFYYRLIATYTGG